MVSTETEYRHILANVNKRRKICKHMNIKRKLTLDDGESNREEMISL